MVPCADVDGQNEVEMFRDFLRSINNEPGKFQACLEMRDKLLDQYTELKWLFASIEGIMLTECAQYKETKSSWSRYRHSDADTKRWEVFLGLAASGTSLKRECLAPLSKASIYWGVDKVQHYKWGSMGWGYCKVLGTAASRNPDWKEASVKLNQLLLKRILSQRPLKPSTNPIGLNDLKCLTIWLGQKEFKGTGQNGFELQYKPILRCDLPFGYTFDQYGLIVDQKFGCLPELIEPSYPRNTNASDGAVTGGYMSSFPANSSECQTSRSSSISFYSPATHPPSLSNSPRTHKDISVCADEESIQYTLLGAMSQSSSSYAASRTVSCQPSIISDNGEGQSLNATQDAAKEEAELKDITRLVYRTLSSLHSTDQNLTKKITHLNQQSESLQMQIEMALIETNEPIIQHIRTQLQNLDEELTKQRIERILLRQDLQRRCLAFLRDIDV